MKKLFFIHFDYFLVYSCVLIIIVISNFPKYGLIIKLLINKRPGIFINSLIFSIIYFLHYRNHIYSQLILFHRMIFDPLSISV